MKSISKAIRKYESMPVQVRASFWFLICSFLQKGISMITTPIFTRLMSTAEYGQFGTFNSWYDIVTIIVTLGLTSGVHTQGLVKFSDDKAAFSSSLQGLMTTLVITWTGVYLVAVSFWNQLFKLTTVQMLSMLIMVWTTAVFRFWANEQRVLYRYRTLVSITLFVSLAKPIVGVLLVVHSDDKVTARILGLVLAELIGYSGLFVVQMKRGRHFFLSRFWKYALHFNLPLVPHYLSQTVLNSADRIMIRDMTGSSAAGIYSLAYSISLIMTLFNTALSQTISPWLYQKIKDRRESEISPIAYLSLLFIAIVNLALILLAPEAVKLFAPESYYDAIWVVPPVAMSVFFMYSYDLFAKFAFYYEKTKFIMVASVAGALLNVMLNYYFIKQFGYIAAGYTTLVCYIVYSMVHYHFMKKVCDQFCDGKYPYETKKILVIAIPFIIVGFLFLFTYNYPHIRYGIVVLAIIFAIIFKQKLVNALKGILQIRKRTI